MSTIDHSRLPSIHSEISPRQHQGKLSESFDSQCIIPRAKLSHRNLLEIPSPSSYTYQLPTKDSNDSTALQTPVDSCTLSRALLTDQKIGSLELKVKEKCSLEDINIEVSPKVGLSPMKKSGSILKKMGSRRFNQENQENVEEVEEKKEEKCEEKGNSPMSDSGKKVTFKHKVHKVNFVENWKEYNREEEDKPRCCDMF